MKLSLKKLKPELWPTLISLVCFTTCIVLGGWQIKRLYWKEELIKKVEERISAEAIELPEADKLADSEYRRVKLSGKLMLDKAMYFGMYYENEWGVKIIAPMWLASGKIAFVNIGWVPEKKRSPENWQKSVGEGAKSVEAIIRVGKGKGLFSPNNDPVKNYWFWYDFEAMRKFAGVSAPDAVMEVVDYKWSDKIPVVPKTNISFPNDHLQYAITWFLLAIGVAVIYIVYTIQRSRENGNSLPET